MLIFVVLLIVIAGGGIFWLNSSAQAAVNVSATLTVYQPTASVERSGTGAFAAATSGAQIQASDSVKTDTKGRASIQLPDGTLTRLASDTEIALDAAHFTQGGTLHDAKLAVRIGRTLTSVQHLVSGATFQVAGQSAVASVRGTKFEVYITADGTMTVKLFDGELDFDSKDGKHHVHLHAGQQATADSQGNIGSVGPIQPDPNDPFGPALDASAAVAVGTTPGTEQDYVGAPLHNGEQQLYTYSYAGGSLVKASLGYPGSAMQLKIQGPDGQMYTGSGHSPIVVVVNNAPAGIYQLFVVGVSGLGAVGEEPFLAVAAVEPCVSSDIDQNSAVRRGYAAKDLATAVQVSGLSNLTLIIAPNSPAGAIVTGNGTYDGVGWTGSVLLVPHGGVVEIIAVGGTVFGVNVPAQQIVQQIGSAIGQDPTNLNIGFIIDRLFACDSVVMIDGRHT
ncbi:MAG: FecR family protein [Candidatus Dormibacteraceae bacterium]